MAFLHTRRTELNIVSRYGSSGLFTLANERDAIFFTNAETFPWGKTKGARICSIFPGPATNPSFFCTTIFRVAKKQNCQNCMVYLRMVLTFYNILLIFANPGRRASHVCARAVELWNEEQKRARSARHLIV